MKKNRVLRAAFYAAGLVILALGIVLNTKSGLGVSPIISGAYCVSELSGLSFGDMTFALYAVFVAVEMALHCIRRGERPLAVVLGLDALQLPLSLAFTRFMNLFSAWIPAPAGLAARIAVLAAGIILTGIGAAMSLDMRLIPNPGDGIVQALADCFKKPVGLTKNLFDLFCIGVTAAISLIFAHRLIGIGFGTVAAMLGVGRVIALFNRLFLDRLATAAGIKNAAA